MINKDKRKYLEKEIEKYSNLFLENKIEYNDNIGLYSGISGNITFLYQYYSQFGEEKCINKIEEYIDSSLALISEGKFYSYTYSAGLAGWAWAMQYLANKGVISDDIDGFLKEIDELLYKQMKIYLAKKDFDQLNGAIGIARYFLYRKKTTFVIDIIDFLDKEKVSIDNEIKWQTEVYLNPGTYVYNLSLAHGSAGIQHFLAECYKNDIKKDKCEELIKGSINFLTNNIQDFNTMGCFFPNSIDIELTTKTNQHSRLAWCYGDLGIFYSLYQTSIILNDIDLQELCLNGLIKNTQRKNINETMVYDAGFCHGSAGNAYIFLKLYLQTDNIEFKEAALFWLDKTIDFGSNKGIVDFKFKHGNEPEYQKSNDFLTGSVGIAMVYAAFISPKNLDWDYIYML